IRLRTRKEVALKTSNPEEHLVPITRVVIHASNQRVGILRVAATGICRNRIGYLLIDRRIGRKCRTRASGAYSAAVESLQINQVGLGRPQLLKVLLRVRRRCRKKLRRRDSGGLRLRAA